MASRKYSIISDTSVKYSHMAAEREARRERLSTDVVLQLLLDERSESENESENLSQYQEFIGKVLTDSDGDSEESFTDDGDVVSRLGQSVEDETHERIGTGRRED